jgi:prolipoprotein diacylglyceryltransferase
MYRGKRITFINYGVFQAASAMSIFVTFYYYLFLKGYDVSFKMLLLSILFVFLIWLGSKFFYYFVWWKFLIKNPKEYLFQTGFSVHGGIIGGIVAAYIFSIICDIEILIVLDALSIGALTGIFWSRLGCFNYGCCYGTPTNVPWVISYTNMDSKILRINPNMQGIHIHPVQLYLAGLSLILFIFNIYLLQFGFRNGTIMFDKNIY